MARNQSLLSGSVYERLREEILSGVLRPNEPLVENEIGERLMVSRTPVREGLQRLAAEELIVPRRQGWAVRECRPEDAICFMEVRICLEGFAASLAASRAEAIDIAELETIHQQHLMTLPENIASRVSTNRNFHLAIIRIARNVELAKAIRSATRYQFNHLVARDASEEVMERGNRDHQAILDAIKARNAAAAEDMMRKHIMRTSREVLMIPGAYVPPYS
ncbi:hypothetical protein ASC75_21110 [Aminobacter sp. DSM 101952]|uniref:GntR family transcriptional regulator n=1 Tax=Aminobacter sp. DSM 101952 TaxID=2735891 RepID=UPI0006F9793B|nr:GntR family transcriptional regulator [Aminobacter sp. DSM 101952]KQU74513.1 hypothetical protein ASC75_21110 [Aminobacter sp. DSM 101952]